MAAGSSSSGGMKGRLILQQCVSARLQVKPPSEDGPGQFVEIKRGLVVYICFMKAATIDDVEKMVKAALYTRLSESTDKKLVSVLDLPGDVLIVPQATLGGRIKGKAMQYHSNVEKSLGLELYKKFVALCEEAVESYDKSRSACCNIHSGTYGNRQVLNLETNGPYSHVIDFT